MPELKPEYQAIAELREFVEQIANGLLQFVLIRGRYVGSIALTAKSRNANDFRVAIDKGLSGLNPQVLNATKLKLAQNPKQVSLGGCQVSGSLMR